MIGLSLICSWWVVTEVRGEDFDRVAALIEQLGSGDFARREAATRELAGMDASLPALKKAAGSPDPETRRRAAELIQRIEKRLETARLLQPKLVRLQYKDTPLNKAIEDFSKTGLPLQLVGGSNLARTITLETEEVPFWEAFHLFCEKAGLMENSLVPSRPGNNQLKDAELRMQAAVELRVVMQQRGRIVVMGGNSGEPQMQACLLVDGKPPVLPTCQVGPLRIRALPPNLHASGYSRTGEEVQFTLELTPDPRLAWGNFGNVRIDKAVDDRGQVLTQCLTVPKTATDANDLDELIILNDVLGEIDAFGNSARHVPVRLFVEKLPAKTLKVLTGTLSAQVRTPPEPLIVVDQVLKAEGKTWRGPEGSSLKICKAGPDPDGNLQLKLEVQEPSMAGTSLIVRGRGGRFRFNGRPRAINAPPANLTLVDADGKSLAPSAKESTGCLVRKENELVQEYHLIYPVRPGQAEPAKLVLTGQRTVAIQVPFRLENILIP
jgi:hypothetical protein